MRHDVQILTQPSREPIDLSLAKQWLSQDDDDQDQTIQGLIRSAREEVENYTGRALYVATYRESLDAFPSLAQNIFGASLWPGDLAAFGYVPATMPGQYPRMTSDSAICLMRSPLIAVSSISYYDAAGVQQTLTAGTDYGVDATSCPGRVFPAPGTNWPATQDRPGAVLVTYTAGYATQNAIPATMLQAMRLLIGHWFENREAVTLQTNSAELPMGVQFLLDKVRIRWEW
jgi:hypothetical protein